MRRVPLVPVILVVLTAAWSTGCVTRPDEGVFASEEAFTAASETSALSSRTLQPRARTRVPSPAPEPTADVIPPDAADVLTLALEGLAQRLEVNQEAIDVISVEAVQWANTSLGCPEPGEVYGETVDSGFRIILRAAGERYAYHTLRDGMVILCEDGQPAGTRIAPRRAESGLDRMVQLAREDLAQKLSVNSKQTGVVDARSVVWPDASLGCPKPGTIYSQVATPGFRIVLKAQERIYEYHTDARGSLVLCNGEGSRSLPPISVTPGEILDGEP